MIAMDGGTRHSLAALVLRLGAGGLLIYGHGWPKLMNFAERAARFSDPIGVGPTASMALAVFAEVFCAALVVIGLGTRLAAVPIVGFFLVIVFIHHGADPFQKKELPLVYLVSFLGILIQGGGRYAFDAWIGGARRRFK